MDSPSPVEHGHSLLRRWEESKPTNFYEDDQHLRRPSAFRLDAARFAGAEPLLRQAGADFRLGLPPLAADRRQS